MRPSELMPRPIIDGLVSLYRLHPQWIGPIEMAKHGDGRCGFKMDPVGNLKRLGCSPSNDIFLAMLLADGARSVITFYGASVWLGSGPKVFRPTPEQEEALENVEVNIRMKDYQQPYPAMALPLTRNPKYRAVLVHHDPAIPLTDITLFAHDRLAQNGDTVIVLGGEGPEGIMEDALRKFDPDCEADRVESEQACRVALNSCLALTHYDSRADYLFPKEVASDRRLAKERSDRGDRARNRLSLAVQVVSFSHVVKLHRTESARGQPGAPTGRQMTTHWRRGHWRMQPHGPNNSLRKRIFVAPVLVREDLFVGDRANTEITYVGGQS